MRPAPAVSFPVGPDKVWRLIVLTLQWLALASVLWWAASHVRASGALSSWPVLLVALVCGAALCGLLRRPPGPAAGRLDWDQSAWRLWGQQAKPTIKAAVDSAALPAAGDLRVALDFQSWMLLRWQSRGKRWVVRWLPVARSADPAAWHLLRCAVYSRPPAPLPSSASRQDQRPSPP